MASYADLITRATPEERAEVRRRVEMIIGTQDQAAATASNLTERIQKRSDAIAFAYKFSEEHEDEFDPTCGGVGITDPDGDVLMNW